MAPPQDGMAEVRGARGTGHQRLKEGVGEACPGRGHQRLKEGACEACLASECAPWTERGREWKGDGVEEGRKNRKVHTISRRKSVKTRQK